MKVTLFVPTLNEIIGMKIIMPRIDKSWFDQIIIADGGSTDGTVEYAKEMGYTVIVQKERGIRCAYQEGFPLITSDIVLTFSPDGNSIPEAIPDIIKKIKEENLDMLIASRYLGDATSDDDDFLTKIGNYVLTGTINLFNGGHFTDSLVIYRAYKVSLFKELELDLDESYWIEKFCFTKSPVEPLLSIRAAKAKKKIGEIGVSEPPRIGGERKLQMFRWGALILLQAIYTGLVWSPRKLKTLIQ
jgi:glycosyltransferase involved in cell wall biosynthesis